MFYAALMLSFKRKNFIRKQASKISNSKKTLRKSPASNASNCFLIKKRVFNPFQTSAPFLHPLKTLKTPDFLMFLRAIETEDWLEMGFTNMWSGAII